MSDVMDKLLESSHADVKQKTGRGSKPDQIPDDETEKEMYARLEKLSGRLPSSKELEEDEIRASVLKKFKDAIRMERAISIVLSSILITIISLLIINFLKAV